MCVWACVRVRACMRLCVFERDGGLRERERGRERGGERGREGGREREREKVTG